eukprot:g2563.t1
MIPLTVLNPVSEMKTPVEKEREESSGITSAGSLPHDISKYFNVLEEHKKKEKEDDKKDEFSQRMIEDILDEEHYDVSAASSSNEEEGGESIGIEDNVGSYGDIDDYPPEEEEEDDAITESFLKSIMKHFQSQKSKYSLTKEDIVELRKELQGALTKAALEETPTILNETPSEDGQGHKETKATKRNEEALLQFVPNSLHLRDPIRYFRVEQMRKDGSRKLSKRFIEKFLVIVKADLLPVHREKYESSKKSLEKQQRIFEEAQNDYDELLRSSSVTMQEELLLRAQVKTNAQKLLEIKAKQLQKSKDTLAAIQFVIKDLRSRFPKLHQRLKVQMSPPQETKQLSPVAQEFRPSFSQERKQLSSAAQEFRPSSFQETKQLSSAAQEFRPSRLPSSPNNKFFQDSREDYGSEYESEQRLETERRRLDTELKTQTPPASEWPWTLDGQINSAFTVDD